MSAPTISRLAVRRIDALMPRPWVPAAPWMHLLSVEVETSDGIIGQGFSWTPTIGAEAVETLLNHDIRRFVVGATADPRELWQQLWVNLHEAGGGGLTTIAMAGLDLALWDAAGQRQQLPLADLLGRTRDSVAAYGSGVNLHYSLDELRQQVERWVDTGYNTVKIKVGSPSLAEDVRRVAAVRDVLGPERTLLIDANQRWDLPTAVTAVKELAQFGLGWIEEPLRADDTQGYVALAGRIDVPIALGENLHTIHRFRDFLATGAISVFQPNVVRVGGITPFLDIAELISRSDATLAPHLLPEISGQLALALEAEVEIEDVEQAGFADLGVLADNGPISFHAARLRENARHPGIGIRFANTDHPRPLASHL